MPETSGFGAKLQSALSALGPVGTGVAAIAGIGLAVGATLLKIGENYEQATNTIIQKTGATGAALASLEGTTKTVYGSTTTSLAAVAAATSTLYDKTKLLGPALSDLTTKQVDLAKITKSDVNTNIQATTAIFGQLGVAAKDQSGSLDTLFKASQVAGVGFDQFTSALQTAAPVAKIMGLNVGQASALVAQLTQIGLPASKVMMGLSSEFAKAAKAGKDPTEVISQMVAEIRKAPNATAAATTAISDFGIGARQAATLVDAVRAGAFNFGATLGTITNGKGGIVETTAATLTLGDKWKIFSHQAENDLQPLASRVLDFAMMLTDKIPIAVGYVQRAFEKVKPSIDAVFKFITDHKAEVIGALAGVGLIAVEAFGAWAYAAGTAAVATIIAAAPIILLVAGLAALGAAVVYAYEHFTAFRDVVDAVGRFFRDKFVPDLRAAFATVKTVVADVVGFVTAMWRRFGDDLSAVGRVIWSGISDEFRTGLRVIEDLFTFFKDIVTGKWQAALHALLDALGAIGGLLVRNVQRMFELMADAVKIFLDAVVAFGPQLARNILQWLIDAGEAIAKLQDFFINAGENLIKGLISGITNQAGNLLSTIKNAVVDAPKALVSSLLHLGSPSRLYAEFGANIMAGLAQGISGNREAALGALRAVPMGVPGASAAGGGTAGSNQLVGLLQAIRANTDPQHPAQQQTKQLLTTIANNTNARSATGAPSTTSVASSISFQTSR